MWPAFMGTHLLIGTTLQGVRCWEIRAVGFQSGSGERRSQLFQQRQCLFQAMHWSRIFPEAGKLAANQDELAVFG